MKLNEAMKLMMRDNPRYETIGNSVEVGSSKKIRELLWNDCELTAYGINPFNGVVVIEYKYSPNETRHIAYTFCVSGAPRPTKFDKIKWREIDALCAIELIRDNCWDYSRNESMSIIEPKRRLKSEWEKEGSIKMGFVKIEIIREYITGNIRECYAKNIGEIVKMFNKSLTEDQRRRMEMSSWAFKIACVDIYRMKSGKLRIDSNHKIHITPEKFVRSYLGAKESTAKRYKKDDNDGNIWENNNAHYPYEDFCYTYDRDQWVPYMVEADINDGIMEELEKDAMEHILTRKYNRRGK